MGGPGAAARVSRRQWRLRWQQTRIIGTFVTALMIASLVHTPAAIASWGVGGVQFGAFTEDGTEFNIQMRNTFGSDGRHILSGTSTVNTFPVGVRL